MRSRALLGLTIVLASTTAHAQVPSVRAVAREAFRLTMKGHVRRPFHALATPIVWLWAGLAVAGSIADPSSAPLLAAPLPAALPTLTRSLSRVGYRRPSADQAWPEPRPGGIAGAFQLSTKLGAAAQVGVLSLVHAPFSLVEAVFGKHTPLIDRFELRQEAGEAPRRPLPTQTRAWRRTPRW